MTATVFQHAPRGYVCPFCRNLEIGEGDRPVEILQRYERVFVKVNPRWWPRNPGSALVIPNDHYENVFDLPVDLGSSLQEAVRDTALAIPADDVRRVAGLLRAAWPPVEDINSMR
jgi:histidine triad (HIT) family protein